jgi:hypothetical protein
LPSKPFTESRDNIWHNQNPLKEIAMEGAARRRKRRREVLAAVLGVVAVVLIWRAIWDIAAAVMSPLTSLIIGLALTGVIGYLNKDYLRELF